MTTLLFQVVGPIQAWDWQSEHIVKFTQKEPTKSGIIGMVCAAMGIDRANTQSIRKLAALKFAVRVDQEGTIMYDYHTIFEEKEVSQRYYLNDAMFLIGLEGDEPLLQLVQNGLKRPKWNLFLGRKSCPPSRPPFLKAGLQQKPLLDALGSYPWLGQSKRAYNDLKRLRVVSDASKQGLSISHDQPINFQKGRRRFAPRRSRSFFIDKPSFDAQASYPNMFMQTEAKS